MTEKTDEDALQAMSQYTLSDESMITHGLKRTLLALKCCTRLRLSAATCPSEPCFLRVARKG